MSIFDSEDRREIDDILFALNKKISYTSYNRTLGKQVPDSLHSSLTTRESH